MGVPPLSRRCIACGATFQPVSSKHLHCSISCVGGQPQPPHTPPGGRSQLVGKYKTLLVALPAVGGTVALGVIGLTALNSAGVPDSPYSAEYSELIRARPRSEYKVLVGKSQDEVKAVLGEPDNYGGGHDWAYHHRGIDPQTNAVSNVRIVFKNGRVSEVTFSAP